MQTDSSTTKAEALDLAIAYCGQIDDRTGTTTPPDGVLEVAERFRAWLEQGGLERGGREAGAAEVATTGGTEGQPNG